MTILKMSSLGATLAPTTADQGPYVRTATFGSIARFIDANDLSTLTYRITPERPVRF